MSSPDTSSAQRPPTYLVASGITAVVASAALLIFDELTASVAGYVLSTFVAITCVTAFRWIDNQRRQDVAYVYSPRLGRLATLTAAAALVVAMMHIWNVATELAT